MDWKDVAVALLLFATVAAAVVLGTVLPVWLGW